MHLDWNQASIDSDHVCREGDVPGDYVQWEPGELFYLHDWNVVQVPDGHDFQQIVAAQRQALALDNGQPTAVIYRTRKGWRYGVEGRASHGAGHKLCSARLLPGRGRADRTTPRRRCRPATLADPRCAGPGGDQVREECFWEALQRRTSQRLEEDQPAAERWPQGLPQLASGSNATAAAARGGAACRGRLRACRPRRDTTLPTSCVSSPVRTTTLREALGRALQLLNEASGGALLAASADLLGSTSVAMVAGGLRRRATGTPQTNPEARLLSIGGICEDAIAGVLSGISATVTPSASARPTGPSWRRSAISPPDCTPSAPKLRLASPASPTGR